MHCLNEVKEAGILYRFDLVKFEGIQHCDIWKNSITPVPEGVSVNMRGPEKFVP